MKLKNMQSKIKKFLKGFTVIELVVAVAVISMLTVLVTVQFRQGERSRGVILGSDIVASAIRTAQGLALNPAPLNTSCSSGKQAQEYRIVMAPNTNTFDLRAYDKCNAVFTLETYKLPNGVVVRGDGLNVDSVAVTDLQLKFTPPFNGVTFSNGGNPFAPFNQATIRLATTDMQVSKYVTYDGISGRVDTEVSVAQGVQQQAPNAPPDCSGAAPSTSVIFPATLAMVPITVTGVTDPNSDPVTITINSIFQDEMPNNELDTPYAIDGAGVGTSIANIRSQVTMTLVATGDSVRDGRVYHIAFTATDSHSATCSGEVQVSVPKALNTPSGDGGATFDSTLDHPLIVGKCDPDSDGDIDGTDLNLIRNANGSAALGPNDPLDGNSDGGINIGDTRFCQLRQHS